MILLALSIASWLVSTFFGAFSLGLLLLLRAPSAEREFPRVVYLTVAALTGAASFQLFLNLGGPRQW